MTVEVERQVVELGEGGVEQDNVLFQPSSADAMPSSKVAFGLGKLLPVCRRGGSPS